MAFQVAVVQMSIAAMGDVDANVAKMEAKIREAAGLLPAGGGLIVLPEAIVTGWMLATQEEVASLAQPVDGAVTRRVALLSRELNCTVVFGMLIRERAAPSPEIACRRRAADAFFNAALVVDPAAGLVGVYRKSHVLQVGLDAYCTKGPGFADAVFHLPRMGQVGINICYDALFPESARALRIAGATTLVLPTAWRKTDWYSDYIVPTRAIENCMQYVACNLVGTQCGFTFEGKSLVVDREGNVLARAGAEEEIITAWLETASPEPGEFDGMSARRPELYAALDNDLKRVQSEVRLKRRATS